MFSDEKKFNLDGPDGGSYYWHDLRREKHLLSKRVQGGGSVMIWAGFTSERTTQLVFIDSSMNSIDYQRMLSRNLLPFMNDSNQQELIFQQDNASCHRSISTHEWFEEKGIQVLDWPSRSPDLNPIENPWGILVRAVFSNGRQFRTVEELKSKLIDEWSKVNPETLKALVNSMNNRLCEVIFNHGGSTRY